MIAADDAGGAYPFDLTGGVRLLEAPDAADARSVRGDRPARKEQS